MATMATIRRLADEVRTGHQGRELLGTASRHMVRGYAALADVQRLGGTRDAARALLDQANGFAQEVFAELPASDAALSPYLRERTGMALIHCYEALEMVDLASGGSLVDDFADGLSAVLATVGSTVGGAAASGLAAAWPLLLILGLGAGFVFYFRGTT